MTNSYPFTSALVTGASSGIGEAMVRLLGEAGIPQVVVARRVDRLEELAARYEGIEVLAADLTTAEGIDSGRSRGSPTRSVPSISSSTTPGSARRASSTRSIPIGSATRSR